MDIAHDFAEVNGVRLHYASAGTRGAPLVLFLHGFPEFWYGWRKQLAEFGDGFYAVAPDMRGYNLSSKPEGVDAYKMTHLRRDVLELARHLGYEAFHLVGHDWGGVVAWAHPVDDELIGPLDGGLITVAGNVPHHDLLALANRFTT